MEPSIAFTWGVALLAMLLAGARFPPFRRGSDQPLSDAGPTFQPMRPALEGEATNWVRWAPPQAIHCATSFRHRHPLPRGWEISTEGPYG